MARTCRTYLNLIFGAIPFLWTPNGRGGGSIAETSFLCILNETKTVPEVACCRQSLANGQCMIMCLTLANSADPKHKISNIDESNPRGWFSPQRTQFYTSERCCAMRLFTLAAQPILIWWPLATRIWPMWRPIYSNLIYIKLYGTTGCSRTFGKLYTLLFLSCSNANRNDLFANRSLSFFE